MPAGVHDELLNTFGFNKKASADDDDDVEEDLDDLDESDLDEEADDDDDDDDDDDEYKDDESDDDDDDESDDDGDSEEEEFDADGFGDAADRKHLMSLPQSERLLILQDRLERREEQRRRRVQWRQIREQKKRSKAAAAAAGKKKTATTAAGKKKAATTTTKKTATRSSSKSKGSISDALADLKKKRKNAAAARKKQQRYESDDEEDDESERDRSSDEDYEEGEAPKRLTSRRAGVAAAAEPPYVEATLADLESIRISRHTLLKWLKEPFADELLPGFYVRVQLPVRAGRQPEYTIAKVLCLVGTSVPYTVPGHANKVDKVVALVNPASPKERKFQITYVSNSPFTDAEFSAFYRKCLEAQKRPPSVHECERKRADKARADNWEYTEEQVLRMATLAPAREHTILMLEKGDLEKLMSAAVVERAVLKETDPKSRQLDGQIDGHKTRLAQIDRRLAELSAQIKKTVKTNKSLQSAETLLQAELRRERNRPKNAFVFKESTDDAAARRETTPTPLWVVERDDDDGGGGDNKDDDDDGDNDNKGASEKSDGGASATAGAGESPRVSLREALAGVDLAAWLNGLAESDARQLQPRPFRPLRRPEKRDRPAEQTKISDSTLTVAEWERLQRMRT